MTSQRKSRPDRFGQDWAEPDALRVIRPSETTQSAERDEWTYYWDRPISGGPGPIYRKATGLTVERWDGGRWVEVDWRWFSRRIEGGDPTLDDLDEAEARRLTE